VEREKTSNVEETRFRCSKQRFA